MILMGFPPNVSAQALAACERCCCICHKFCGTKMELHHIKQSAYGGEDTFENCIPLCLDCHEDMGKADPKHPKGKRYSEEELRLHRDNWYSKVKSSGVQWEIEVCDADRELFRAICDAFTDSVKFQLTSCDMGGTYQRGVFDPIVSLLYNEEDPFFEFINFELEKLRCSLFESIDSFTDYLFTYTFPVGKEMPGYNASQYWLLNHDYLPARGVDYDSYCEEFSGKFEEIAQTLNSKKKELWKAYCDFVRQSRKVLKE